MIILTGASGGIGQAIINQLSEIEPTIGLYHKHLPEETLNPKIAYRYFSLENMDEIKFLPIKETLNHITLIHLAAIKIDELAVFVNEANWDKVFNVNVKGAFFLTKELLPIMMKEKFGRIIWVISSGLGDVGTVAYSSSKFALLGLSQVISKEYARYGVTSNVLQLGYFQTGMWNLLSDVKKDELLNQIPSKKLGNTSDIVNMIKTIIDSPFVNGSVLNVDGGV
jgi:NAD(P)-dependent dehydrogenase (short-subunit alcohol dehydrogenase family)